MVRGGFPHAIEDGLPPEPRPMVGEPQRKVAVQEELPHPGVGEPAAGLDRPEVQEDRPAVLKGDVPRVGVVQFQADAVQVGRQVQHGRRRPLEHLQRPFLRVGDERDAVVEDPPPRGVKFPRADQQAVPAVQPAGVPQGLERGPAVLREDPHQPVVARSGGPVGRRLARPLDQRGVRVYGKRVERPDGMFIRPAVSRGQGRLAGRPGRPGGGGGFGGSGRFGGGGRLGGKPAHRGGDARLMTDENLRRAGVRQIPPRPQIIIDADFELRGVPDSIFHDVAAQNRHVHAVQPRHEREGFRF